MSNTALILLIVLVLAIIGSNIWLLKQNARFGFKQKDIDKAKEKEKEREREKETAKLPPKSKGFDDEEDDW